MMKQETKTLSESLFESLCDLRNLKWKRITTNRGLTSDYRIWLGSCEVIVEIKQIEFGDHEKKLLSNNDPEAPFIPTKSVQRLRGKFDKKAKKQLKANAKGKYPSIFCVYDNTRGISGIGSDEFLEAMYGDDVMYVMTKKDPSDRSIRIKHQFGGNRKLDKFHNRFVSAFAQLKVAPNREPFLIVYHNDYADIPLNYEQTSKLAYQQYKRIEDDSSRFRGWELISNS